MSYTAMGAAMEVNTVRGAAKFTLVALANFQNQGTKQCNPTIPSIAEATGFNRKTIMKSVAELEEKGLITVRRRLGAGSWYELNLSHIGDQSANDEAASEEQSSTGSGTAENQSSAVSGTAAVPKTGHKPVTNREKKKNNINNVISDDVFQQADSPPPDDPAVYQLPTNKPGVTFGLRQSLAAKYRRAYPLCNLEHQLARMDVWLEEKPGRTRTPDKMLQFIGSWLAKEQTKLETAGILPGGWSSPPVRSTRDMSVDEQLNDHSWVPKSASDWAH